MQTIGKALKPLHINNDLPKALITESSNFESPVTLRLRSPTQMLSPTIIPCATNTSSHSDLNTLNKLVDQEKSKNDLQDIQDSLRKSGFSRVNMANRPTYAQVNTIDNYNFSDLETNTMRAQVAYNGTKERTFPINMQKISARKRRPMAERAGVSQLYVHSPIKNNASQRSFAESHHSNNISEMQSNVDNQSPLLSPKSLKNSVNFEMQLTSGEAVINKDLTALQLRHLPTSVLTATDNSRASLTIEQSRYSRPQHAPQLNTMRYSGYVKPEMQLTARSGYNHKFTVSNEKVINQIERRGREQGPDFIGTKSDFRSAVQNCLLNKSTQPTNDIEDQDDMVMMTELPPQKAYQPYRLPHQQMLPAIKSSRYFEPSGFSMQSEKQSTISYENPADELLRLANQPKTVKYSSVRKTGPVKFPVRDVTDTKNFSQFNAQEPFIRAKHAKEDMSTKVSPFMNRNPLPFAQSVNFKRTGDMIKDFSTKQKEKGRKQDLLKVLNKMNDSQASMQVSASKKLTLVRMISQLNSVPERNYNEADSKYSTGFSRRSNQMRNSQQAPDGLRKMGTFAERNPKFAKTKTLELTAEEEEMLNNDRPVEYMGQEIRNLDDMRQHISLDPQSSIDAQLEREQAFRRGRDVENNELTLQQKQAKRLVKKEFTEILEEHRPKGEYYNQSTGDFLLYLTRVDKKLNYDIEEQEREKATELMNSEFQGKGTGDRASQKTKSVC